MTLALPLWLALAVGCVNETGYDRPPGDSGSLDNDDALGGGDPTGDLDGGGRATDGLYYSAEAPLGMTAIDVVIVAVPETFGDADALWLSVDGAAEVPLTVVAGGFVQSVEAVLGDAVEVLDVDGVVATLTLDDDLSSVAEGGTDTDTDAEAPGLGSPSFDGLAGASNAIEVGDGQIPGFAAPYLVFNLDQGVSVRVTAGQTDATLAASEGDKVCVAPLDDEGRSGVASCETLTSNG